MICFALYTEAGKHLAVSFTDLMVLTNETEKDSKEPKEVANNNVRQSKGSLHHHHES